MRARVAMILIGVGLSGCARAFIKTEPPGARLSIAGKQIGTGSATVQTPKGRIVIVHADHEGFRPTCAIVQYRKDQTIALTRALAQDVPMPSDSDIERAWIADGADLCAKRYAQNVPPEVVVTAGDLSRPYDILGEVRVDTTEEGSAGIGIGALGVSRGGIFVAFRPELKGKPSELLTALRDAAIGHFGVRVDAVVNAHVFAEDSDLFARGVAVHFLDRAASSPARTVSERLDELDKLGASGAISPTEYKERRKAILNDL